MSKRSVERGQPLNDSLDKKSPTKQSPTPSVTTRSRRSLNQSPEINKSPTVQFKQELKIETNYFSNGEHPNLPSANSSDFSVVYVDDSDATNQSDLVMINDETENIRNKRNKNSINKSKAKTNSLDKMPKYKLIHCIKEEHSVNVYDVKIYRPFEENPSRIVFAAVGNNQCAIYEYIPSTGDLEPIEVFLDADPEEDFFVCAWTTDPDCLEPLLVVAGNKGIIRTIDMSNSQFRNALIGHGASINDLKFHPTKNFILLSASKDYTLRLWNINTTVCIGIFGGAEGHTDQVLSADINNKYIISCGIDHYLKIWNIDTPKLRKAIETSEIFDNSYKSFPTISVNFPDFSTRDVHTNYVDCVRWFGDLVISKSCENLIVEWKPGLIDEKLESMQRTSKNISIMYKLEANECDIWFVRFGMDYSQKFISVGTINGKIYVWDLELENSNEFKKVTLSNPKSKGIIRSVALSMNANDLIASNNLGNIFIWKKE